LILPEKQKNLVLTILNEIKAGVKAHQHGSVLFKKGFSALFSGPSGTGKTMAAEALSHALNMPLYQVDLSQVVNKYIGETEKNLNHIFNATEGTNCILFFDEADVLFGKRTDVKDTHVRYANIEPSYLLGRIESFNGIVILATNLQYNIDNAFIRRLRYVIEFPLPGKKERQQIWEQVFQAVDSSEIDISYLARQFKLTGGHIRNIALNACLQSIIVGQPDTPGKVTMKNTLRAVKQALEKKGAITNRKQFGQYADLVKDDEI